MHDKIDVVAGTPITTRPNGLPVRGVPRASVEKTLNDVVEADGALNENPIVMPESGDDSDVSPVTNDENEGVAKSLRKVSIGPVSFMAIITQFTSSPTRTTLLNDALPAHDIVEADVGYA